MESRAATPAQRLLAIFDVFGEWFARDDFEGCSFINVMLELDDPGSPVRRESVRQLLGDPRLHRRPGRGGRRATDADGFARQWHILMKGCIVAAAEGDRQAGARARELGTLLLSHHGIEPARRRTSVLPRQGGRPTSTAATRGVDAWVTVRD